jgi:hypothetical protein
MAATLEPFYKIRFQDAPPPLSYMDNRRCVRAVNYPRPSPETQIRQTGTLGIIENLYWHQANPQWANAGPRSAKCPT